MLLVTKRVKTVATFGHHPFSLESNDFQLPIVIVRNKEIHYSIFIKVMCQNLASCPTDVNDQSLVLEPLEQTPLRSQYPHIESPITSAIDPLWTPHAFPRVKSMSKSWCTDPWVVNLIL